MKKVVLGFMVAQAFVVSSAWSQSSVTVSGLFDLTLAKTIGSDKLGMRDPYGSRITFKGQEDLGDGLSAFFFAEQRIDPTTGAYAAPSIPFNGGTYLGLQGGFGRVMAGRYWTAAFHNVQNVIDPFGSDLAGLRDKGLRFAPAKARFGQGFRYDVSTGGFGFGFDYSPSTGVTNAGVPDATVVNNPWSVSATWKGGPVWVGFSHEDPGGANDKLSTLGAKYTVGGVTLRAGTSVGTDNVGNNVNGYLLAFNMPVGIGDIHAGYATNEKAGVAQTKTFAVGYDHWLSKRTKLYFDVVNDSVPAANNVGYNFGMQHSF